MTSSLCRIFAACAVSLSCLSVPAAAEVTPYATMWGFHHCPTEIPDPPGTLARDQQRQDDATARHIPEQIGFDDFPRFCKAWPSAVLCGGTKGGGMLTFAQVYALDLGFRMHFTYRSDNATAGRDDYWRHWTVCGDCEDYALSMSEVLARNGQSGANMKLQLMEVNVNTDKHPLWVGHATLWVVTADRGTVEISVGDGGNPHALDMSDGLRMGTIRMDGFQTVEPLPGYHVDMMDHSVTANTP